MSGQPSSARIAYAALVLFLRISGKRTLAKLNAFDLVVTVALGSTLSAIILQESIALAKGADRARPADPSPVSRHFPISPLGPASHRPFGPSLPF